MKSPVEISLQLDFTFDFLNKRLSNILNNKKRILWWPELIIM